MNDPRFDFKSRWLRAASLMERDGIDALFLMKPANLAYLTGDGRPCALGLLTRSRRCIVVVPASDLASVRRASAATDLRVFRSEEEMFHGFRDVLRELDLSEATIAVEKNFFDAALFDVFTSHVLLIEAPMPRAVAATRDDAIVLGVVRTVQRVSAGNRGSRASTHARGRAASPEHR